MEDHGNLICLDLIDQKGNGLRIGFRILGASRKSRIICQTVLLDKVQEGEAISHDDLFSGCMIDHITEALIQIGDLFHICLCILLILLRMRTIQLGNRSIQFFDDLTGIGRSGPYMLIHFRALLFLCTLFCFLFGLHAFRMLFF